MKTKSLVYDVVFDYDLRCWHVYQSGLRDRTATRVELCIRFYKAEAVQHAVACAQHHRENGGRAQVLIRRMSGAILNKRRYGKNR